MYLLLKLLHLTAVIAFLGNVTTGVFWHKHAEGTRDPKLLAHTMDGVIRSDRLFTIPGVILITVAGFAAAIHKGLPILGTPWIFWTIVLFSISGFAFSARVAPLQKQLRAMAREGAETGNFEFARYHALARRWELWGGIALATPLAGMVLMVLKPM
jgi:uncharacterized membrane protein